MRSQGAIQVPKHRCQVPLRMPWVTKDTCQGLADVTWVQQETTSSGYPIHSMLILQLGHFFLNISTSLVWPCSRDSLSSLPRGSRPSGYPQSTHHGDTLALVERCRCCSHTNHMAVIPCMTAAFPACAAPPRAFFWPI